MTFILVRKLLRDVRAALIVLCLLLFAFACVGIAGLPLLAPRRPRLGQLAFLVVAIFLIVGKVWSQQYVLWLIPLAVLARPRWGAFLAWQVGLGRDEVDELREIGGKPPSARSPCLIES